MFCTSKTIESLGCHGKVSEWQPDLSRHVIHDRQNFPVIKFRPMSCSETAIHQNSLARLIGPNLLINER